MTLTNISYEDQQAVMDGRMTRGEAQTRGNAREAKLWVAFCERHGQDPDDPDAFCATPSKRLERMMVEAGIVRDEP